MYVLPSLIKKTITFRRLKSKNVHSYNIYSKTIDNNYTSGIRTELIDTIINPNIPSPVLDKITLKFSKNYTWKLPSDIYLDKDHPLTMYVNDVIISNLYYTINRAAQLITINTNQIAIDEATKIEMQYYKDIIVKDYMFETDCTLMVEPVFQDTYNYGKHNIIL